MIFAVLFVLSLLAEVLSNDRPLVARYQGKWYFPIVQTLPETTFGGDFVTPTDCLDPQIQQNMPRRENFALFPLNRHHYSTINYFATEPSPAKPSRENLLGTDDRGRDLLARLLYGFRLSVLFALLVTRGVAVLGILYGAIQGYFAGWTDIAISASSRSGARCRAVHADHLLVAVLAELRLLVILLSLFGWLGISDYVRAEFLRNRKLEYVHAARALGLSNRKIIWRHMLPNSLTPVMTFLPFRMAGAILALTSLDFLGLGVPPSTPSLGELLTRARTTSMPGGSRCRRSAC